MHRTTQVDNQISPTISYGRNDINYNIYLAVS